MYLKSIVPLRVCSIALGLTPVYNIKSCKLVFKTCFKCYALFLVCLLTILSIYSYVIRIFYVYNKTYMSLVTIVLDIFTELPRLAAFFSMTLGASFWNENSWKNLFAHLQVLENQRYLINDGDKASYFSKSSVIFYTGTLYYLALKFYAHTFWPDFVYWINTVIIQYIEFVFLILVFNLALVIKCNFKHMNDLLSSSSSYKIGEVGQIYLIAAEVVRNYNRIIGWPVLGIFFVLVTQVLNNLVSFTIQFTSLPHTARLISGLFLAIIMFGPLTLLFCCHATAEEAANLLTKCYEVHQKIPIYSVEDKELTRLEDLLKSVPVVFTAAGFFRVNRSTLLYLLGTITTYFIVAIQLNSK